MIPRVVTPLLDELRAGYPVITITGTRQSGKTTLARAAFPDKPYVSLETPDEREFTGTDPRSFLARWPSGVIIDEVQHVPQLFLWIQTDVDACGQMGRYVLTGSQNFALMAHITQSLAGRSTLVQLLPLSIAELAASGQLPADVDAMLVSGGYLPGWKTYFRMAQTPTTFRDLDSWIRRRLRPVQLKQWKRGTTIYRELCRLGASHDVAVQVAATGRRWWHTSRAKLHQVLTVAYFDSVGIPRFT